MIVEQDDQCAVEVLTHTESNLQRHLDSINITSQPILIQNDKH